jgi:hypothetical protein
VPKAFVQKFFSKFGLFVINGLYDLPQEKALNHEFPDIKPMTARDMLGVWKDK